MRKLATLIALGTAFGSSPALSGGYDTPILFSAQHMGMGGAAIGYVDDPSAIFHNPAGLARTHGLTLMANVSLLTGTITASPEATARSVESNQILSVAPLVGASYRISDLLSVGLGFYPVAAAGGEYEYTQTGAPNLDVFNSTAITFLELSPAIALHLPYNLRLGLGYRISFASLERIQEPQNAADGSPTFDAAISGTNFAGIRVGLQWDPIPELQIGFSYRHKTTTTLEGDGNLVLPTIDPREFNVQADFVLPSQMGLGLRGNFGDLSAVLDVQYTLQSQNDSLSFITDAEPATAGGSRSHPITVTSVFEWLDNITLRAGLEYRLDKMGFRLGYIFDGQVNQEQYPSAFGTPPAATNTVTAGWGIESDDNTWELNTAIAYRFGSTEVRQSVIDDAPRNCLACSEGGDYDIGLLGVYVDFAYRFDLD